MKRVYISADIEGITGVTDWNETYLGHAEHPWAAHQMTAEVAAACRGAFAAGAEEIWVKDAHDSARNIDIEQLPEGVKVIRGWMGSPDMMMAGIHEGFDCALCIGYHSEGGTDQNPLAHTISKNRIAEIQLNGKTVSELEINSYTAAIYHVPILFVSGDEGICRKAEELMPGILTTAVKRGVGQATINLHPHEACRLIEEQVKKAVERNQCKCPGLPEHFDLTICYREHADAKKAAQFPGARSVGPYKAGYCTKDFRELLIAKMFMI